jgi:hypothetical protein
MLVAGASRGDAPSVLSVAIDGGDAELVALDERRAAQIVVPAAQDPGLRIDLFAERGAPRVQLRSVTVGGAWPAPGFLLIVSTLAGLATVIVARAEGLDARAGLALAPMGAAAAVVGTALATGALSAGWTAGAVASALLLITGGALAALRESPPARAAMARGALVIAAIAFGASARWIMAPSAGSWDMEYWRAWTESTAARGLTGAYGPPLADGAFLPTLRGDTELWMVAHDGRRFPVDYPPLALLAWRVAAAAVPATDADSWNLALKLPALAGDLVAIAILIFWWPGGRSGARAAALYWAIPSSWLSSATLGYLDGAYAPFVLAAAVAAGSGRAGLAGAALAVAALLKPTALVAAPAIAVALLAPRRILVAIAAGLAVVAAAIAPLALAGTLGAAIAHVLPILYQERLSGGYANAWWILGAIVSGDTASVPYVRIDAVPLPVRALGVIAFAGAAAVVCRALARARSIAATVAASAALFAAYGVLGVGVHVNHPHPLVLLFLASSLGATAWRWPAWLFIHAYALNILLLEQLGRLAGPRYGALERVGAALETARHGAGIDLTLALGLVHVAALAALVAGASQAIVQVSGKDPQVNDLDRISQT